MQLACLRVQFLKLQVHRTASIAGLYRKYGEKYKRYLDKQFVCALVE